MHEVRAGAHRAVERQQCAMRVEEALVTERVRKPEGRASVHWLVRRFGREGGPGPFINPSHSSD